MVNNNGNRVVWMLWCLRPKAKPVPDSLADTVYHLETTDDVLVIETDASSLSHCATTSE